MPPTRPLQPPTRMSVAHRAYCQLCMPITHTLGLMAVDHWIGFVVQLPRHHSTAWEPPIKVTHFSLEVDAVHTQQPIDRWCFEHRIEWSKVWILQVVLLIESLHSLQAISVHRLVLTYLHQTHTLALALSLSVSRYRWLTRVRMC
jgi:hypothetical protein